MQRLRVEWSGSGVVGPGLTTFYADEGAGSMDPSEVVTFFDSIKALFPSTVTWTIPGEGDMLNEGTGELAGTWSASGGGTVAGTSSASYAAGVGARVRWNTAGIVGGRRVRGSTFLVPLTVNHYDGQGTLESTAVSTLATAAGALVTGLAGALVVWSRPAPGRAGTMHAVTGSSLPDRVSWLRSRRT